MKKLVKTVVITTLLSAVALMASCSDRQTSQTTASSGTTEATTQTEATSEQTVDQVTFSPYTTWLGDISLDIEDGYQFIEKYEDDKFNFKTEVFNKENGMSLRIISKESADYTIDEAKFEEELTVSDEIHVIRTEVLDIKDFGKVYGALLDDSQLNIEMFYYKFAVGDNVYSIVFVGNPKISEYDEGKIKRMITSLKHQ